jgi:hypothetical protein
MMLHFKSKEGFQKWEAYKHKYNIEGSGRGNVMIHGHLHRIKHKTGI